MGDYPIQYCDTATVRLCQYNISCHRSLNLSACELSMFKLYLNVSLVSILFEYFLFSMHDMTDSFVINLLKKSSIAMPS